jgi:hypothetical protein
MFFQIGKRYTPFSELHQFLPTLKGLSSEIDLAGNGINR